MCESVFTMQHASHSGPCFTIELWLVHSLVDLACALEVPTDAACFVTEAAVLWEPWKCPC